MIKRSLLMISLVLLSRPVVAGAAGGATLVGRIKYEGIRLPPAPIHAHINSKICGAQKAMLREDLVVSLAGGLANVAVELEGVPSPESPALTPARLDQVNCTFIPHVQTLTAGSTLTIGNSDPVIHNIHARARQRTIFNLAMPLQGITVRRRLDEAGVITLRCDSGHTWMSAFLVVVPHPFHATSDADGRFAIRDLPAGSFKLRAWHELLGVIEQDVTIGEGRASEVELTYRLERQAIGDLREQNTKALEEMGSKLTQLEGQLAAQVSQTKEIVDKLALTTLADRKRRLAVEARPLYLGHCATCHGAHGKGDGPSARFLSVPPRDFTRGDYKFRLSPSGSPPSIEDLYRTITVGVRGTEMPGWRQRLSRSQRRLLAEYLTTFSEAFDDPSLIMPPIVIPEPPPVTAESIARGAELFKLYQCVQCHGEGGRGDGPSATGMVDGTGRPIRPANLARGIFKGGAGRTVIYRTIMTGLSGTPMPSFGDSLEEPQRWDLVAYVASLSEGRSVFDYLFGDPAGRMTTP